MNADWEDRRGSERRSVVIPKRSGTVDGYNPERLFENFRDGVEHCTTPAEDSDDEIVAYNLFEEFYGAAVAYLHDDSLRVLRSARLIDDDIVTFSQQARSIWFVLMEKRYENKTPIAEIRIDPEWQALFALCDEIKRRLDLRSA
jgi:hypothetical protein